ncbi:MAG: hypothetical protein JST85_17980 [Acidobacteria bacterium]|nr:hypothetical protein [Acidobacteriota bacterium]
MIGGSLRLDVSVQAMRDFSPNFSLSLSAAEQGIEAIWQGRVQPIQSTGRLAELLDDIHYERPVWVQAGGEICHHPNCSYEHTRHDWLDSVGDPFVIFDLEVGYSGGKRHPKVFVRSPAMPPHKIRRLFGDGSICPYAPWENVWLWDRDTVVNYMGHAVVWLIKWIVWDQAAVWIEPELSHYQGFLVRTLDSKL